MAKDKLGFLYPTVDEQICIHCGLCESVCPADNKGEKTQPPRLCWGGYAKSETIRKASSSGGLFTLFAEAVLNAGGDAFGARVSADCTKVYHCCVESIEELSVFRGSKYVQSELNECYPRVKHYLESGRKVLFSGTPCQVDGLRLFLGKDYSNLLSVELICHGTPSPRVFEKYIEYMGKKLRDSIVKVNFRDEIGGSESIMRIETENGYTYRQKKGIDPYYKLFLSDTCLRDSCYQCPSRGLYRRSDITLSDFWGVEKVSPDLMDGGGISLVLLHTEKGEKAFREIADKCSGHEVEFNNAISGNPTFFKSYPRSEFRDSIEKDIERMSFSRHERKYTNKKIGIIKRVRKNTNKMISKIKRVIKRVVS